MFDCLPILRPLCVCVCVCVHDIKQSNYERLHQENEIKYKSHEPKYDNNNNTKEKDELNATSLTLDLS